MTLLLKDIDEDFTDCSLRRLVLRFENGDTRRVSTSKTQARFEEEFVGKEVTLCYRPQDKDEWIKTSKLMMVAEVTAGNGTWHNDSYFRDRSGNG